MAKVRQTCDKLLGAVIVLILGKFQRVLDIEHLLIYFVSLFSIVNLEDFNGSTVCGTSGQKSMYKIILPINGIPSDIRTMSLHSSQ